MFSFRKPKTGSEAIYDAIGQFESIARTIESGVSDNEASKAANEATIAALRAENNTLDADAARGKSVAAKLRDLLA